MRSPVEAVLLILSWEQLRLVPYRDAVGLWTVGWGHLLKPGEPRKEISRTEANRLFLADLAEKEQGVVAALGDTPVEPHEFGALVSFAFNLGIGALRSSTLLKLVKAGDSKGAARQFERWVYGTEGGRKVKLNGLVARREDERRLFVAA